MAPSRVDYLADFDSATAMLRALAAFLHCRDFANLGLWSALKPVVIGTNRSSRTRMDIGSCAWFSTSPKIPAQ